MLPIQLLPYVVIAVRVLLLVFSAIRILRECARGVIFTLVVLRRCNLSTLYNIANGENATIVFPVPIDILHGFFPGERSVGPV